MSGTPDVFKENLSLILHKLVDQIPFRFESELNIFHNAVDNIDKELENLFKPIPQAATIGSPDANLAAKVDELTKLVQELTQAQVQAAIPPVENSVTSTDPVPVPDTIPPAV